MVEEGEGADNEKGGAVLKPLSKKRVERFKKEQSRRGIVYLSRLPPFFKPNKIRSLLGEVGRIDRVYLRAESEEERSSRLRGGGSRRVNFKEGWVEFYDKRDARRAAVLLNNKAVGGRKRNYYHDDVWSIRYLKGFKWTDLTDEAAADRRTHDIRLRHDISEARKERDEFLDRIDQAQAIKAMESRKASRTESEDKTSVKVVRKFQQNVARRENDEAREGSDEEPEQEILAKIFGKKR
ncbi:hypothetical protein NDN08_003007 [Rhodosorus marinus]|uniref:RRM domain-containing protein n=1 Tax=Rhodosorus marinus TaxID=101924 RepID=A0AAV8UVG2_9RHOD|nr:hypothetical protein NDN08_003007 [Rhodosorus marinus]